MPGKDQAEKWNVCGRNAGFQWISRSGRRRQEWEESMEQIYDLVILGSGPRALEPPYTPREQN